MMITPRQFKNAIYEEFARIGKAVSSPRRLELLDLLCQGPRTVEMLAELTGQSIANTSHHLQVLRATRLVEGDKEGVHVRYRLADQDVCVFYQGLRQLAEAHLAEIESVTRDFLARCGVMEPVDSEDLLERVRRGEVTVLDVRPSEEYRAAHIPGALSIPLDNLERRLGELPRDREVVAYCRGPYCVLAVEAVEVLKAHGFRAVRLEDGVPDWRARGFEVGVGE
jgi:rhodanese-related sulfurtransferase/DNA-binding transcriptional ArsR family regulator